MTQDLLQLISNEMKGFSKGQKRIGAFILEHYDKAAFMTAAKLGETVGVSESTVVRFAAELGFEGYPQLQKSLQDIIRNRLTTVQRMEIIDEQLSGGVDVLHRVMSSDADKIRRTQEEIDPKDFDTVIDSIIGAHRIYILGLRSSGVLAGFLSFYFNHIFEDVVNVGAAQGETFEQMLRIGPNDVLIALFPADAKGGALRQKAGRLHHRHYRFHQRATGCHGQPCAAGPQRNGLFRRFAGSAHEPAERHHCGGRSAQKARDQQHLCHAGAHLERIRCVREK